MKNMADMLLAREPFSEIVMGNTALVRAMVEAGTRVVTSYPGSPTPEIATAIGTIPRDLRPFYFEFSTNEKVATEVAYGAAVNGHMATVFFKSVGLNVAADTFVQLSMMNIIGGMVVVLGDDPGANSSQNEQDNRHLARMSYTPVLEPADPQEVYDFYLQAADFARANSTVVILRLTTHVCHAKQRVDFGGWNPEPADDKPRFDPDKGPYIPLADLIFPHKQRALDHLKLAGHWAESPQLNRLVDNGNALQGVITAGLPFHSLMDVLEEAKHPPDVLKLGMPYPLPANIVASFLESHREVKILEELDPVMEIEIKALAFERNLQVKIIGKTEVDHWMGEYTPDKVRQVLYKTWPDMVSAPPDEVVPEVASRPAQLCPGCGHRSAFYAIKKALAPADITVADIGCHTLGFLPPYQMGQLLMCMGASTAIGAGLTLFNHSRKVVAFIGDSTFFHAGIPGIVNAVFNRHPLTLIVMENGTTAMTGHQDHAATGRNFNRETEKISIRKVLESLGVKHIFEIDTYRQDRLRQAVEQAVATEQFAVVIARHPCMLKFARTQRRKPEYRLHQVGIDQQQCRQIHTCVTKFGCPSFVYHEDGQVTVNPDLCIGDGSCLQTCPRSAITKPRPVD